MSHIQLVCCSCTEDFSNCRHYTKSIYDRLKKLMLCDYLLFFVWVLEYILSFCGHKQTIAQLFQLVICTHFSSSCSHHLVTIMFLRPFSFLHLSYSTLPTPTHLTSPSPTAPSPLLPTLPSPTAPSPLLPHLPLSYRTLPSPTHPSLSYLIFPSPTAPSPLLPLPPLTYPPFPLLPHLPLSYPLSLSYFPLPPPPLLCLPHSLPTPFPSLRLLSEDLGSKMRNLQNGQSIPISIVTPTTLTKKALKCDEDCAQMERNMQLAAALDIKDPSISPGSESQFTAYLVEQAK